MSSPQALSGVPILNKSHSGSELFLRAIDYHRLLSRWTLIWVLNFGDS